MDDVACIDVSFPSFSATIARLDGGREQRDDHRHRRSGGFGQEHHRPAVARRLGLTYLDTGAMYRAVTLLALEAGRVPGGRRCPGPTRPASWTCAFGRAAGVAAADPRVFLGGRDVTEAIRSPAVSPPVSQVSAHHEVRQALTAPARGRVAGRHGPRGTRHRHGRLPAGQPEGLPDRLRRGAGPAAARAARGAGGPAVPGRARAQDLPLRDSPTAGRALAPLRKADDALEVDTTHLTIDEVVDVICALAVRRGARAGDSDLCRSRRWHRGPGVDRGGAAC